MRARCGVTGIAIFMTFALATPRASQQAAVAQESKPAVAAEASAQEQWSVTQHSIRIGAQTIPYKASAGTTLLKNDKGEPTGLLYSVAYTRSDVTDPSTRPVSFLYNGGPGSATMWLHMGAFGPRRVSTVNGEFTPPAPYKLVDNTESLLDKTDLVFIDAMGTGYSRAAGKAQEKDFYGVDEDAEAFAQFIVTYISRNDRWNSPKFLIGESYGTFRSAALGNLLQEKYSVHLNGIDLISSVLDLATISFGPGDDRCYVYYLPSYAAVAWYHKALKDRPFFQAEDGIRDPSVTGVQTCALPIYGSRGPVALGGGYRYGTGALVQRRPLLDRRRERDFSGGGRGGRPCGRGNCRGDGGRGDPRRAAGC